MDLFAKSKDRSLYLMTQYVKSVADVYKETVFTGYQHRKPYSLFQSLLSMLVVSNNVQYEVQALNWNQCLFGEFALNTLDDGI